MRWEMYLQTVLIYTSLAVLCYYSWFNFNIIHTFKSFLFKSFLFKLFTFILLTFKSSLGHKPKYYNKTNDTRCLLQSIFMCAVYSYFDWGRSCRCIHFHFITFSFYYGIVIYCLFLNLFLNNSYHHDYPIHDTN